MALICINHGYTVTSHRSAPTSQKLHPRPMAGFHSFPRTGTCKNSGLPNQKNKEKDDLRSSYEAPAPHPSPSGSEGWSGKRVDPPVSTATQDKKDLLFQHDICDIRGTCEPAYPKNGTAALHGR